ncbi:hypothetical protein [Metabacillus sediminilitoris]|jgi:hypothetical protein|uniref:Uncharacterized protein n=1 Tax=Metabacillus sediminilitoris TaxID=2567941 RepID=A0A4S4BKN1_9BACI|nr:hypothetical protein [Metabacillus sediminilitoris]QGQ46527.1 hypothetical protein GMB29_15655 [Metabacillus sediminilitoris]THF75294.1 hypothetical protein E6W99_23930 [Metabacillus sediminilitoris]
MSLEWFDRVSVELQDHLESICDKYDQVGQMSIDRGAKHPRIEFFVETEDDDRDYFCTLFFDPHNEDFYIETFDFEYEQTSRMILSDIEEIVDAVHESFHSYMNDDYEDEDEDFSEEYEIVDEEESDIFEEIDVEWETPEVTAFKYEDEVEVTYQFGIVQETGDGVLRRLNRIKTSDDDLIKDETNFIFSKEEASTIIAMIASHMDSLSEFDLS